MIDSLSVKQFCLDNQIDQDKPILLWVPHFQFELSSLPVIWDSLFDLEVAVQWVLFLDERVDPYFFQQMKLKSLRHPSVKILSHGLEALVNVAEAIICERYSWLPKTLLESKRCFIVNSPHQVNYTHKNKSASLVDHHGAGQEVNHFSELKSILEEAQWMPNSLELNPTQQSKIHVWIAPQSIPDIQEALSDEEVEQVVLYQSRLNIAGHPKLTVLNSQQELKQFVQSNLDAICLIQFQPGKIQGDFWDLIHEKFRNNSSLEMAGPLCISGSVLAKVHHHIKLNEYHLQTQVTPDALASFIRDSNQDEHVLVPEIDTSVFFAKGKCLEVLADQGLKEMLKAPQFTKLILKDLLLPT